MGAGIAAAIPIVIKPHERAWARSLVKKDFPVKFFDNYTADESGAVHTLNKELLLNNYKSFYSEFLDCIGDQQYRDFYSEDIPVVSTYEEFKSSFSGGERNNRTPYLDTSRGMFSMSGGVSDEYWLFYSGSYKAYLETYDSLLHFERILEKAMTNPLASCVKFGIHG
jgi:hypothetical protein